MSFFLEERLGILDKPPNKGKEKRNRGEMGVMSRKVVPACGSLCFFCPSLRARSRQPVKRYKKLLADIFPRSQDAEPNDRKIGKLCDYASKNPLRIPKITDYLEQRFYKDLRNEHLGSVKVVLLIYRKLLSSCKEQMPLFASSLLGIVRTLLEQSRYDDMVILGCSALIDFLNYQTDSTYMYNLEGLIPKLCQLAREVGCEEGTLCLKSAGMQVLAALVQFMGATAHFLMDFDNIITATLENYPEFPIYSKNCKVGSENGQSSDQAEKHGSSFPDIGQKSSTLSNLTKSKMDLVSSVEVAKNPSYWSRVCLKNMVLLAKEATTVRRVFEPLFHCFDSENHWLPEKGLACSVLTYMQSLLEDSEESCHLILSILVKHLDHKGILKQANMQIYVVKVATELVQSAKQYASAAIIGAMSDLMKHLRKCMLHSAEASNLPDKSDLQNTLESCISHFSQKVGDVGPILDMLAVVLENLPAGAVAARATIYAVHQTSQIVSSLPNLSYYKKAFPDALFHHLLLAMAHPDHETRAGAHRIFSTLLMPSLSSIWSSGERKVSRSLSEQSLMKSQKMNSRSVSLLDGSGNKYDCSDPEMREEELLFSESTGDCTLQYASQYQSNSFRVAAVPEEKKGLASLRLSSHQVGLLLSSIWVQATSAENLPANFEAMAHTYSIALLFSRSKNSSHRALVRCFQLAFSLRSISRDDEGRLQPSRRRSLFTLASFMLTFSARAGNFPDLILAVKSSLMDEAVDPFLKLVDDIRLQALCTSPTMDTQCYGSPEDEDAALKSLSAIKSGDQQLKELAISHFMTKYRKLSKEELLNMKEQLLLGFAPDDDYPVGVPLFMETPCPSPIAQFDFQSFDESIEPEGLIDDDSLLDSSGNQSDRKTSLSITSLDIISVNQLLESVLETARQVASIPVSATPTSYDHVKSQCEALVTGKQQKMLALQSFKVQQEMKTSLFHGESEKIGSVLSRTVLELTRDVKIPNIELYQSQNHLPCSQEYALENSLRLPPSSPYDKFLKAAGC